MDALNKIITLLATQNKTQKDLSDYLNVQRGVFTKWKSGSSKSYMKHISKIAEFLNVSPDYLLGNEQKEKSSSQTSDKGIKFALFGGLNCIRL